MISAGQVVRATRRGVRDQYGSRTIHVIIRIYDIICIVVTTLCVYETRSPLTSLDPVWTGFHRRVCAFFLFFINIIQSQFPSRRPATDPPPPPPPPPHKTTRTVSTGISETRDAAAVELGAHKVSRSGRRSEY